MAHGRYSYVAVGKEAVKGQKAATINTFLRHASAEFNLEREVIESKALTGRLLKYDTAIGTRHWSGKIDGVELDATNHGLIFKSFFGSETVAGTAPAFKHTFKLTAIDDYTSLTVEQYKVEWLRFFLGGRVTSLTFKGELNSIMAMDVEMMATNFEEGNIADKKTPTFQAAEAFRFYETKFKVNNNVLPVKSFEIKLTENVEADYNFMGGKFPTKLERGGIEGEVSFELNLSEIALDFWEKMLAEEDITVTVEMTKNANEKLVLTLPRVRLNEYTENSGDEILKSNVSGIVLSSDIDEESIKLELTNARDTEY